MLIRSEIIADAPAIADINIRAFGWRLGEPLLVALLRQYPHFTPELSLIAEVDGRAVGQALFLPYTMRLMGMSIPVVNLAPLAIHPDYQKQGIGGALIEEGHRIAREKGYVLSILLGHTEYYPRFGYRTGMFGSASIEIPTTSLPTPADFDVRTPIDSDIPQLLKLWEHEEGRVDFSLMPSNSVLDWISPHPQITSTVYLSDGQIVGYTRIHAAQPTEPRYFLAADDDTARQMVALIGKDAASVKLPLHPHSASARAFGKPQAQAWDAAMAYPLVPDALNAYISALSAKSYPPGRPIWGTAFDLA
jgi:putative acetyltransferase